MKLPARPKKGTHILVTVWRDGYHDLAETSVVRCDSNYVYAAVRAYLTHFERADEGKTWVRSDSADAEGFRAKFIAEQNARIERKQAEAIKREEEEKRRQERQLGERDGRIVAKLRKAAELVKAAETPEALQEVAFAIAVMELDGPRTLWPLGWR